MIGGRKTRSNKGKKRSPYRARRGSKVFSNNVSNVTNNAPVIRAGTNVRPTFNTNLKVRAQANRVANAVQRVKDAKYKLQLENTAKAVQRVKDAEYKLQLEKTAKAVQKVKNTKLSKRKVRSNKGKKRGPYSVRGRTRSGKKFRGGYNWW